MNTKCLKSHIGSGLWPRKFLTFEESVLITSTAGLVGVVVVVVVVVFNGTIVSHL